MCTSWLAFGADLTLVIEDLGWYEKAEEARPICVTTPEPILRGVLERLQASAEDLAPEIDLEGSATENRKLIPTCRELLACLPAQDPGVIAQESKAPPKEGPRLAQREVLVAALKAHPKEMSRDELIESVSKNFFLPVDLVAAVVDELLEMGLIVIKRSGITAGPGLLVVNRSWPDLTEIY